MSTFRRSLRIFFGLAGFLLGVTLAAAAFLARTLVAPIRQGLWATPADAGLEFENAEFPAQDGVRLSGWFVPAAAGAKLNGATIVLVHGWQWNRLGYRAQDLFANVTGSTNIDLLFLVQDLHKEGFNVLTFDLRNHGQSATSRPVSFGQSEAKDLLGAMAYLEGRDDVDANKIGVIGFSIGANAALFTLPQTDKIRALVAVQPTTPSLFTSRLAADFLGIFGSAVCGVAEIIYQLFGGTRMEGIVPAFAAAGASDTPVLFLQGTGDRWGSSDDISRMAEMTPRAQELLFVNSTHRFGGYQYLIDHPAVAINFFNRYLLPN